MSEAQDPAICGMKTQPAVPDNKAPSTSLLRGAHILSVLVSKSLQDLNDARCRWIPRDALLRAISPQAVDEFLRSYPEKSEEQRPDHAEIVRRISPPIDECQCQRIHCTGGRILFATSLSLYRPELVRILFWVAKETFCDADLACLSYRKDALATSNYLAEALRRNLPPEELERFVHFTWQMASPILETLASQSLTAMNYEILELPTNASLPWLYLGDAKDTYDEATTVQKIIIHPAHHEPGVLDGDLALKTICDDYYEAEAQHVFEREVRANLRAPKHERIVPLLAAFKHRGRFHLILPWACGGNLADLFQRYAATSTTKKQGQKVALWYSEYWLLTQCLGLAAGLFAVHRTTDDPYKSAQVHADVKPENVLCFASSGDDCGPFDLKLADFGVAQKINPETETIPVKHVPHTKTYRPPEHDTDDALNLKYDVWCLGCVFLEFLTWAIAGSAAIDNFENDRLEERDERKATTAGGNVYSDTFFRKASRRPGSRLQPRIKIGHTSRTTYHENKEKLPRNSLKRWHRWSLEFTVNVRVKAVVKTQVKEHINFLKTQTGSEKLNRFLEFIESSMLVIDTKKRATSGDVYDFLRRK